MGTSSTPASTVFPEISGIDGDQLGMHFFAGLDFVSILGLINTCMAQA